MLKFRRYHTAQKSRDDPVVMARRDRYHTAGVLTEEANPATGAARPGHSAAQHGGAEVERGEIDVVGIVSKVPACSHAGLHHLAPDIPHKTRPPMPVL